MSCGESHNWTISGTATVAPGTPCDCGLRKWWTVEAVVPISALRELIATWRKDVEAHAFVAGPRHDEPESIRSNRAYNNALLKCVDELEQLAGVSEGTQP